jgi:hypothetical protein
MLERLGGFEAVGAGRVGARIVPRGVGREIALAGTHLVDPTGDKLPQSHKRVGVRGRRVWVVSRRRVVRPVFVEEVTSTALQRRVRGTA